jgi:hypothetical protein
MSNVQYVYNTALNYAENTNNLNIAQIYTFNMPVSSGTNVNGINAIASLPAPTYHAWTLDSSSNYLYRINTLGQILTAININSYIPNNNSISANLLAVDGKQNVWVTLNNTASTIKFDSYGNFLFITAPNTFTSTTPVGIDTDTNNNVWVAYSTNMVKYSNLGTPLRENNQACQSIVIDTTNNVWLIYNSTPLVSYIRKYNSAGTGSTVFPFGFPLNQITLDINQNIWFAATNTSSVWFANPNTANTVQINLSVYSPNTKIWSLNGIGGDIKGNIFVINSPENRVYIINCNTRQIINDFYINPKGYINTFGDWTGLNWYRKYANILPQYTSSTQNITITGKSVPLDFVNFQQSDIFKINENFDLAGNMQSLAFTPTLIESNFLFENFLGSIYGKYPFNHDDVGVTLYEKIANYVSNISDIDYCNVEEIYNLAQMVDIELQDFNLNYPEEVRRVVDLASVNLSRLIGARSVQETSFTTPNSQGKYNMNFSPVNSFSYKVTAGIPLVLKDRSLNQYRLINTGYINCSAVYTLNQFANYLGFHSNWRSYYEFHQFIPNYDGTQVAGLIDWNNPQTTIQESLSTLNNWYGTGNYLDTQFSYELYNGLGLL